MSDEPVLDPSEASEQPESGNSARFTATLLVALATLALLFVAAASVFFLIAEVLSGAWMLAGSAVVVLAFLLWLGNRLVHVAANQNKNPLG